MNDPHPTFGELSATFSDFLNSNGWPPHILWVFREDVFPRLDRRTPYWILQNDPDASERLTRRLYDRAIERGLGLRFQALCKLSERTAAYILAPRDEIDADRTLLGYGSRKLSVPTGDLNGKLIRRRWFRSNKELVPGQLADLPRQTGV